MLSLDINELHAGLFLNALRRDTDNKIGRAFAETNRYVLTSYDDSGGLLSFPRLVRKSDQEMTSLHRPGVLSFQAETEVLLDIFNQLLPDGNIRTQPVHPRLS